MTIGTLRIGSGILSLLMLLVASAATAAPIDQSLLLVQTPDGHGSGFLFGDARTVVTNRHVVEGMAVGDRVELHPVVVERSGWSDLGSPSDGRIRYIHPALDLAVIEVSGVAPGAPLAVRDSVSSRFLPRGESVLAHGFPSLGSPMMSKGIICGHWRDPATSERFYLTDAALAEGSSGGPVTDANGRLIGIAVAVYDVPEEVGYEWGFVIPASALSDMFPGGPGVRGLPQPLDVDALVRSFKQARITSDRYARGRDAVDRIADESHSLDAYLSTLDRYVRGIEGSMRVDRPEDVGRLVEFNMHVGASAASRAISLMMRDELPDDLEVARFTEMTNALDGVLSEAALREWMRVGRGDVDRTMTAMICMMEVISEAAEGAAVDASIACGVLEGLIETDQIAMRSRSFVDFPEQLSTMIMGAVLVDRARSALADLPSMTDMRSELSLRHRTQIMDVVQALESAIARWDQHDASCRMLCEIWTNGDGPQSPDGFRAIMRENGQEIVASDVFVLESQQIRTFGWDVSAGTSRLAILAVSDGGDIDLILRDPSGREVDRDEALDNWPLVSVEYPDSGEWSVDLINATNQTVEAEMEIWE